jgi:hypothetical protein
VATVGALAASRFAFAAGSDAVKIALIGLRRPRFRLRRARR